ncbi:MAG: class I SAM-dependent methyltransferase [Candidatus Freyrarchaeum guaymaensis]
MSRRVREQYSEWASTYDEEKVKLFERAGISYREFMDSFVECCGLKPGMSILDVGAGTCLTSICLAKALSGNCRIRGIEPVGAMVERAEENIKRASLEGVISVEEARGESIPWPDESYDLVVCTFAIRHMDIETALREFLRVLKPGGRIVIAEICAPEKWRTPLGRILSFIVTRFLSIKRKHRSEAKSRVLTVSEWKQLLERVGVKSIRIREFYGKKDPGWETKRVIICVTKRF